MTNEDIFKLYTFLYKLGVTESSLTGKDLPGHIATGSGEFKIEVEACFDEETKLQATLYFYKMSGESYYLLKYNVHLRYLNDPSKDVQQDFYLVEMATTLKEAFNLLQGRCVETKVSGRTGGDQYMAWVKLNFGDIDRDGNYTFHRYRSGHSNNLENDLDFYSNIAETQTAEGRLAIIQSLRQGDRVLVTFMNANGKGVKKFIEANPRMKTLKIYDATRKPKIKAHLLDRKLKRNDIGKRSCSEDCVRNINTTGLKTGVRDYEFD